MRQLGRTPTPAEVEQTFANMGLTTPSGQVEVPQDQVFHETVKELTRQLGRKPTFKEVE